MAAYMPETHFSIQSGVIEEAKQERPFNGGLYLHPRQVLRELEGRCRPT